MADNDAQKNTHASSNKPSVPNPFAPQSGKASDANSPSSAAGGAPPNIPQAPKPQAAVPKNPVPQATPPPNIPVSKAPKPPLVTKKPTQKPVSEPRPPSQPQKKQTPPNFPVPQAPAAPKVSLKTPLEKPRQKATPTPVSVPAPAAPKKEITPFVDEVLKPKEAPRKNPLLEKKDTQVLTPVENKTVASSQVEPAQAPISSPQAPPEPFQNAIEQPVVENAIDEVPPLQEVPPGISGEDLLKSLADTQVSGAEKRAFFYKLLTGLAVLGFLVAVTFGAVFVYNKWVKPSLNNTPSTNEDTDNSENTNTGSEEPVDPALLDTDGDTLKDAWETSNGLNPEDPADAFDDPDFDQLKNIDEFKYGTNPQDPDSDADGFRDGVEVQKGFNPNGTGELAVVTQENVSGKDFKELDGNWSGTFNGAHLFANDLDFKLDDEGGILGTFTFVRQDGSNIFSQAKGLYTYNKNTGQFSSDMNVKGFYEQESVDYTMKITGQSQGEGKVSGTWTIVLSREVPWISSDNGTFTLSR